MVHLTHDEQEQQYFGYMASKPGASFFIAAFGLLTFFGCYVSVKFPKAKYMYILPLSTAIECVGYGTRLETIITPVLGPLVVRHNSFHSIGSNHSCIAQLHHCWQAY
jgi:hypothetical protein